MALLQKKPQVSSSAPLYTVGLNKTVLLVGLGNLGKKYENTRHNIGFLCIDQFVAMQEWNSWIDKKDLKCQLANGSLGDIRVLAIKPATYMNNSGQAVQAVANFYKIAPQNIVVIHDELDLAFGQIRTRLGGSSAGHNGVDSLIKYIGDRFGRIRVGVKNDQAATFDGADFVLAKFTTEEQKHIGIITKEVIAILNEYIFGSELPTDTRNVIT